METRARHSYFRISPDGTRILYGGRAAMVDLDLRKAAARLHAEDQLSSQLITFASPNPGNAAFGALFGGDEQPTSTNYENYGDIVPLLPPNGEEAFDLVTGFVHKLKDLGVSTIDRLLLGGALLSVGAKGYTPVNGTVLYVDQQGAAGPAPDLETKVANVLANYAEFKSAEAFAAAHCHACRCTDKNGAIGCAGGYMRGACGTEICGDTVGPCPSD